MEEINRILKHYYGYDSFRPGQKEIILNILKGKDVCAIMPTGAGKSVCYQVPALAMDGITLVISPLISLMQDQVRILKSVGVPAAYLNSSLTPKQIDLAISRAVQGMYKIIYVAPERLESRRFLDFAARADISLVAVDEAHCISMWGQDFRPSYRKIAGFIHKLSRRCPVAAFTATANARVKKDIIEQLHLHSPYCLTASFDRPNLYFGSISMDDYETREFVLDKKTEWLRNYLPKHRHDSGIIYCLTQKQTVNVADELKEMGYSAAAYHAGMKTEDRRRIQEDFTYGRTRVIAATNAFGMGIDKPDVRFVVHYGMPSRLEDYYQQAGRAGRDGEPAECILLYSYRDYRLIKDYFILRPREEGEEDSMSPQERKAYTAAQLRNLEEMKDYALSGSCLRNKLLRYFGEKTADRCGHCSVCRTMQTDVPQVRIVPKEFDEELYIRLKARVRLLSLRNSVPVYTIAVDSMLRDMAAVKPMTKAQLKGIPGFGEEKIRRYGDALLAVVKETQKR